MHHDIDAELTPDERIDAPVAELRATVASELREQVLQLSLSSYETLVLDLLRGLGYDASDSDVEFELDAENSSISGVISLDRLGFEKMYVRALQQQQPVGQPELQRF